MCSRMQGSPKEKFKAEWVGMVWVATSIIWLPHQRNMIIEGMGGHSAERDWGKHWYVRITFRYYYTFIAIVERRYQEISRVHCHVLLQVQGTSNNAKAMNK